MQLNRFTVRIVLYLTCIIFSFVYQPIQAGTKPKFLIVPRSATQHSISPGETVFVSYQVTNNTTLTRTLTMVPISGVSPIVTSSSCANPFTLSPRQTCELRLQISGSHMPTNGIQSGPVICKTEINKNTPDPFLCSQPGPHHLLNITPGGRTTINAFPNPLYVVLPGSGAGTGLITIQNTGRHTVNNLQLALSTSSISYTTNCGSTLNVGASCSVNVSASVVVDGQLTVTGDNANLERVSLHFVSNTPDSTLSIVSPVLSLRYIPIIQSDAGPGPLVLTIKNNGPIGVSDIDLGAHTACPAVNVSNTTCAGPIPAEGTCQLTLESTIPYVPCEITITATNAVPLNTYIAFEITQPSSNTPGVSISGLVYRVVGGTTAYIVTFQDPAGVAGLAPWWTSPSGDNQIINAQSATDGSANTALVNAAWLTAWSPNSPPQDIATAVCVRAPMDPTWYLPALCELSGNNLICSPGIENIQTNLYNNGFLPELKTGGNGTGIFFSSTEANLNNAYGQNFATNGSYGIFPKLTAYGVRCVQPFAF